MQTKKTAMILATVLIIVSLTGCGGYGNKMEGDANVDSISNSQSTGVTGDVNESTYNSSNSINDLHITYNNNFNDGYAWIGVANTDSRYRAGHFYIDKSGNVYPEFNIGANFDFGEEWKGGTVCASNMIYNAKGETIFKTDDTYTDILAYGDGYYMIAKNVHDMTTDKDVACFLSTEGEWLDFSVDLGKSVYYKECGYLGEGIFYAENKYINVKTKKSIDIQYYGGGSIIGQFLNGVAVATDGNLIYSNGTVKKTGVEGKIRGSVSDGGFIYTNQIDVNGKFNDEMTYVYFYDINKGQSYLITEYMEGVTIQKQVTTGTSYNYRFENGSLFLALTGVDGETYLNCFDKSGNKLMESKSFGHLGKIGERACGRLVAETQDGAITIYDDKCNIILETKEYRVSNQIETLSYSDDYLAVWDNYENIKNINYIDKDGNLLFAKGLLDENLKKIDYKQIIN